jgi:large subunit ribosomal protein L19
MAKHMNPLLAPLTKENVEVKGTNLIGYLRQEQRVKLDKDGRWSLFSKTGENRINAGSMLKITYKTSTTAKNATNFTGVLLSIHRHPSEPTILLRTVIDGVGVEQKFCVFSPLIQKIEVLKPATLITKQKLYLLRDKPGLISKYTISTEDQRKRLKKLPHSGKLHRA